MEASRELCRECDAGYSEYRLYPTEESYPQWKRFDRDPAVLRKWDTLEQLEEDCSLCSLISKV